MQFWFDLWVEKGQFNTTTFNVGDLTLHGRPEGATEIIQNAPQHVQSRLQQVLAVAPHLYQD